jgi:N-acetylglucosamine-6-sulfatase
MVACSVFSARGGMVGSGGVSFGSMGKAGRDKFNVIVFVADDLRWDGPAFARTINTHVSFPEMDALKNSGMYFEHAYVTSTLCSPSRATFYAGRYPKEYSSDPNCPPGHNVIDTHDNKTLSASIPIWIELLDDAGWATGHFGKWHLNNGVGPHHGVWWDKWSSYNGQGAYWNWTIYTTPGPGLETQTNCNPDSEPNQFDPNSCVHIDDKMEGLALDFIDDHNSVDFAMVLSFKCPHGYICIPPYEYWGDPNDPNDPNDPWYYKPTQYTLPGSQRDPNELEAIQCWREKHYGEESGAKDTTASGVKQRWARCDSCIKNIDDAVGNVMDKLDTYGITGRTMVIFTSDSGHILGQFPHDWGAPAEDWYADGKRLPMRSSIRVPFFMRYDNWYEPNSTDPNNIVTNLDIAKTVLAAAEVTADPNMRGQNIRSIARTEFYHQHWCFDLTGVQVTDCPPCYEASVRNNYTLLNNVSCSCSPASCDGTNCDAGKGNQLFNYLQDPQEIKGWTEFYDANNTSLKNSMDDLFTQCYGDQ